MLQNFYGIIEVKHYQLGRLRLQTDVLKKNTELREEFQNNINKIFKNRSSIKEVI